MDNKKQIESWQPVILDLQCANEKYLNRRAFRFAVWAPLMSGWFGAYMEFLQALVAVFAARMPVGKLREQSRVH